MKRKSVRYSVGSWTAGRAAMPPNFAALFVDQGHCIGFNGSQMDGPAEIQAELSRIFADHVTPATSPRSAGCAS
jgi:hypothetical protein